MAAGAQTQQPRTGAEALADRLESGPCKHPAEAAALRAYSADAIKATKESRDLNESLQHAIRKGQLLARDVDRLNIKVKETEGECESLRQRVADLLVDNQALQAEVNDLQSLLAHPPKWPDEIVELIRAIKAEPSADRQMTMAMQLMDTMYREIE